MSLPAIFRTTCPTCGRENDLHTHYDGDAKPPREGDLSVCWGCKNISIYTAEFQLRLPSEEEAAEYLRDPEIQRVLHASMESYSPNQALNLLNGDT